MVSTYGYLTAENLEKFTGIDYSAVNAAAFSDANVDFHITTAEELVNTILGVSVAQTVTNAITVATKFLSAWSLYRTMDELGFSQGEAKPLSLYTLSFKEIYELVKDLLSRESDVGVDSIPMSGADRTYSTYRGSYY